MQTIKHSWIEVIANIGSGFVISMLIQHFVVTPIWNLPTNFSQNIGITILFTIVSIIRSILFRRYFNKLTIKHYEASTHG